MDNQDRILIVGAGPTGLVLALSLCKQGSKVRIIEKNAGPAQQSRAIAVHARTLEFYQQLGVSTALLNAAILVDQVAIRKNGRAKAHIPFGAIGKGLSPFPVLCFIAQDVHEAILIKELQQYGIEIEWNTILIDLQQDATSVQATVQHAGSQTTVSVPYVCGCDGAHSTVRKLIKAEFTGGTYPQLFYVADVVTPAAVTRLELCLNKKDINILMPVRQTDSVRVIGMIEPALQASHYPAAVQQRLLQRTGLPIEKINWFSPYQVHHRMVEQFSKGRVFLLGDAAHIHSPAGGQGMNTGIGDAVNLAWKLTAVLRGQAHPAVLATYDTERVPFARTLLSSTDRAFQLLTKQSMFGVFFRYYLFPWLLSMGQHVHFILKTLFKMVSQIKIKYPQSPLSLGVLNGVHGGDRLPWIGDNYQPLQSLSWQCHVYGEATLATQKLALQLHLPLHCFAWRKEMHAAGFYKDGLYLIRPDGYVAVAITQTELPRLKQFVQQFGLTFAADCQPVEFTSNTN